MKNHKLSFIQFNQWLVSMQSTFVCLDRIYKDLVDYFTNDTNEKYDQYLENMYAKYLGNKSKQVKYEKQINRARREDIAETNKNLRTLLKTMKDLNKQMSNMRDSDREKSVDMLTNYIDTNIIIDR